MITHTRLRGLLVTLAAVISATLAVTTGVALANPIKLVQSSQIGWEVNKTTKTNICTVASNECQPGQRSSETGGFTFPESAAGTKNGNFYVADQGNHRIQEFEADGKFVLMFGNKVNATTGTNTCTQEEITKTSVKCTTGIQGTQAGQIPGPVSVTVDPVSENVYVAERIEATGGRRVQEFTAAGQFILEIGNEVNETKKTNLCTQKEIEEAIKCGPAQQTTSAQSAEHGAFDFQAEAGSGNVLAAGGEHDLLYVGGIDRAQEFDGEGEWKGEIQLDNNVGGIAVDDMTNDVYLTYIGQNVVYEFDKEGKELAHLEIPPRVEGRDVYIGGLAVDSPGHIAVTATEEGKQFGSLYESVAGPKLPGFTIPEGAGVDGIGFDGAGELFAAAAVGQEILSYVPKPVAELRTGAATCKEGAEKESSVTFDCQLGGEVNPYNVAETNVWFEWGRTCAFGIRTPAEEVTTSEALEPVSASIGGLRPKEAFCYELAGNDLNVQPPEQLNGEPPRTFDTPAVSPKVVGAPSALFVKSSSAVLYGEVNPENSDTEYFFELAPELTSGENALASCPGIRKATCPGVIGSEVQKIELYGRTGATAEASGLQPSTIYQYRLAASNEGGTMSGKGKEQEGTFTTLPAPQLEADTGSYSQVTSTSALISGIVNPNGQPATYTFELGVYQGAATQFGTVFSGPTGSIEEAKSLVLTGLQPGTEYAYQIKITSGYGTATGTTVTFKTAGIPEILIAQPPLPMLPTPKDMTFPKTTSSCKQGYVRNKQDKCIKTKKQTKTKTQKHKTTTKKKH